MRAVFHQIYQANHWQNDESVSGAGSTLDATEVIRRELPALFEQLEVETFLDIPCGDLNWISQVPGLTAGYVGADIVPELIESARDRFPEGDFRVLDITQDLLPRVDLILCRDLLGHFSNADVQRAIRNIKRSGAKWLLATTFPGREDEVDIETGQWRPINLARLHGLPNPELLMDEGCQAADGQFADKSLGLWRLHG